MPRRNRIRDHRQAAPQSNRRWISLGLITLGAVLIVGLLVVFNRPTQAPAQTATDIAGAVIPSVPQPNGRSMGDANAPVKVDEYSDFQCPYCKQFFTNVEPTLITKYISTGKVLFTYNPFSFIGEESKLTAEAAFCAADQNKFWDMHFLIFNAQGAENSNIYTKASLVKMGSKIKFEDPARFNDCLNTGKNSAKVDEANQKATGLKVESTPSFFVNGKGPLSMNQLVAEIDLALAGK